MPRKRPAPSTSSSSSRARARDVDEDLVDLTTRTMTPPARPNALDEQRVEIDGVVYQEEWVKCGSRSCWCAKAWPERGHGPYWYAYYVDERTKRWRSVYVGKEFRRI